MSKKIEIKGWRQIGGVAVDSGQLMITDPCYLGKWKDNEMEDKRVFVIKKTGKRFKFGRHFQNFETEKIYKGKNMNTLLATGEIIENLDALDSSYSYAGACDTTCNTEENAGGLGFDGEGVVFTSGLGDGYYPVYAHYECHPTWGTRITQVFIDMGLTKLPFSVNKK